MRHQAEERAEKNAPGKQLTFQGHWQNNTRFKIAVIILLYWSFRVRLCNNLRSTVDNG